MAVHLRLTTGLGHYAHVEEAARGHAQGRVVIADDDDDLRNLLAFNLREAGFTVDLCRTGEECLLVAVERGANVVVLDLMLPSISGIDVCIKLRADPRTSDAAVMMLTSRGDEYDRVLGFEVGADDYVVKPYSVREVTLRLRSLALRAEERRLARLAADSGTRHRWLGLELDPTRHIVTIDGAVLELRPMEYTLLETFMARPGHAYTRKHLLSEIWGIVEEPTTTTRTVDTHVRRLRERLGSYGDIIETVHGVGYRLKEPPRSS